VVVVCSTLFYLLPVYECLPGGGGGGGLLGKGPPKPQIKSSAQKTHKLSRSADFCGESLNLN